MHCICILYALHMIFVGYINIKTILVEKKSSETTEKRSKIGQIQSNIVFPQLLLILTKHKINFRISQKLVFF